MVSAVKTSIAPVSCSCLIRKSPKKQIQVSLSPQGGAPPVSATQPQNHPLTGTSHWMHEPLHSLGVWIFSGTTCSTWKAAPTPHMVRGTDIRRATAGRLGEGVGARPVYSFGFIFFSTFKKCSLSLWKMSCLKDIKLVTCNTWIWK